MKKIVFFYWHSLAPIKGLEDIPHLQEFPYSKEKRDELVDRCLELKYPVQLLHREIEDGESYLLIATTTHTNFNQR